MIILFSRSMSTLMGTREELRSTMRKSYQQSQGKLVTFTTKIKRSYSKFKFIGIHIKERVDNEIMGVSHVEDSGVKTKYSNVDSLTRCKMSTNMKHSLQDEHDNNDFSTPFTLHPLREGKLEADIALDTFPSQGNLLILVWDYKLEIYTLKNQTLKGSSNKITNRAMKCVEMNLPIFINPKTLSILVQNRKLTLNAHTMDYVPHSKCSTGPVIIQMKIPS